MIRSCVCSQVDAGDGGAGDQRQESDQDDEMRSCTSISLNAKPPVVLSELSDQQWQRQSSEQLSLRPASPPAPLPSVVRAQGATVVGAERRWSRLQQLFASSRLMQRRPPLSLSPSSSPPSHFPLSGPPFSPPLPSSLSALNHEIHCGLWGVSGIR